MYRLHAFFKRLRLSKVLLVIVTTSVLTLSTACSQAAPPAALNTAPSNEADIPRLVDRSASPSRDASIEAKQRLIDQAKQQRTAPPRDTFGTAAKAIDETAQDLSENISSSVRGAAQQTRQTLEETSDVIEDRSSDVLQDAQQAINSVIDGTKQTQQALENSVDALEDRANDALQDAQHALDDAA
ncbi:hypothetical protein C1752_07505 [Acaryochloris thomasi RCC1774]|uniref:Uncharacterized protein n=1 Tax=Acaryochloris thomasi RCC1774 TaxID=1764569 RepID=A0A2W1JAS0_9CYAN|nr:hypothetical protein [Acaryochloris thomasi]PZD71229.1 hypothetical protein C1752_07505 [Acaryochloris thomasi RCC1774]